jgi:hypothetical protein
MTAIADCGSGASSSGNFTNSAGGAVTLGTSSAV